MIQNLDSLTNNVPNLSYSMRLSKLQQMWKPLKGLCGEVASLEVMPSSVPHPNFCRSCSVGICEICNAIKCLLAVCYSGYTNFLRLPGSLKQLTKWLELC
ncbi:hypothetical protein COP2_004185 [Malus domestica]